MALLHKLSFNFGSISKSFFLVSLVQSSCQIVPMYIFTLGFRYDQQTCERAVKLDAKAAFASLSALSFPGDSRYDLFGFVVVVSFRRL